MDPASCRSGTCSLIEVPKWTWKVSEAKNISTAKVIIR